MTIVLSIVVISVIVLSTIVASTIMLALLIARPSEQMVFGADLPLERTTQNGAEMPRFKVTSRCSIAPILCKFVHM